MSATPSNPRACQHSMVTDLCGLCIRDQQINDLHRLLGRCETFIQAIDPTNGRNLLADIRAAQAAKVSV